MGRQYVVAGKFYDLDAAKLQASVDGYLATDTPRNEERTLLAMVPHAGYLYSGAICGKTLAKANLAPTVLLLGPNHTGLGERLSLWSGDEWMIPGGDMKVDEALTKAVLDSHEAIAADTSAHVVEHSLEVVLPFLHRLNPETTIVPLSISSRDFGELKSVGQAIGKVLRDFERPVSIVVSSDMSHYVSAEEAKRLDTMAIDAASALDPEAMFSVVVTNGISMCGVLPMTVGLYAALEMGATKGELAEYGNSGDASGDYEQVVGYAGVIVS